jgi:hypothetical protein
MPNLAPETVVICHPQGNSNVQGSVISCRVIEYRWWQEYYIDQTTHIHTADPRAALIVLNL